MALPEKNRFAPVGAPNRRQELFAGKTGGLRDVDPRIKIIISLSFSLPMLWAAQGISLFVTALAAAAVLRLAGQGRTAGRCLAVYAVCWSAVYWLAGAGWKIGVLASMFLFTVMKFMPMMMLAYWLVSTIKTGEFIAALERMRLPAAIIIPLAVLLRFLPTVQSEFRCIRDTMKMRGLAFSVRALLFHPIRTMEYMLVPLLLRSVKVADELSAAAFARGLDSGSPRTSLRDVRILWSEVLLALVFAAMAAGICYADRTM